MKQKIDETIEYTIDSIDYCKPLFYPVFLWFAFARYEGYWKDGKQHGHGEYTTTVAALLTGCWICETLDDFFLHPCVNDSIFLGAVVFLGLYVITMGFCICRMGQMFDALLSP